MSWQRTRTGCTWHAISKGRTLCGVKPYGKLVADPPEGQLRCGNCLRGLA